VGTADRRTFLRTACACCAAVGLAACTSSGAPLHSAAGHVLAKLADIPVGGSASATSPDGKPLLLARPTATTVVAFSAVCTHQGCTVEPAGSQVGCPCHDAVYDAFTGAVVSGPAPLPLTKYAVAIRGAEVVTA